MVLPIDYERPLAEQVYAHFARAIRAGELRPGDRLPPSRRLAAANRLSRNTVVAAYAQLLAEGYVEGRRAKGTVVARDLPRIALDRAAAPGHGPLAASRPGPLSREGRRILAHGEIFAPHTLAVRAPAEIDFSYNSSVADDASRRAWARAARRVALLHEADPPRWNPARIPGPVHEQVLRHVRLARAVRAGVEQVFLIPSQQTALGLATRVLLERGDVVAIEDPHYLGARNALRARGARLVPVPVDAKGLRTDRLPRGRRTRLLYTTPSHQWPTGVSQPLGRRLEVLEWARAERAWILENDHNCEYLYEGNVVQALQGLDPDDRVIHMGTFSRLIDPYPAIAYVVVPRSLAGAFRAAANLSGVPVSALESGTLHEFMASGQLEKLLRRASRRMRLLQRTLLDALRGMPVPVEVQTTTGGLHVYVRLPGWTVPEVDALVERAAAAGVRIYPGAPFHLRPPGTPGVLLGFAQLTGDRIEEGVRRIARAAAGRRAA